MATALRHHPRKLSSARGKSKYCWLITQLKLLPFNCYRLSFCPPLPQNRVLHTRGLMQKPTSLCPSQPQLPPSPSPTYSQLNTPSLLSSKNKFLNSNPFNFSEKKMCRGFQPNDRDRLKIKAFYVHLSFSSWQKGSYDSLTLHLLPRINGGPLEIDGLNIRPDTPGFITLHRVTPGGAIYGSRERLRVSEGSRFEVYAPDGKVLKGCFRKDEGENWKLDCTSQLEGEGEQVEFLEEVDVCVEVDGHVSAVMTEKVKMAERKRRKRGRCFQGLEEIPEVEREVEREFESDGCCCCCCDCDGNAGWTMDGADCEMDGVSWAVDVGIWVICLGVGYLVSKASRMRVG